MAEPMEPVQIALAGAGQEAKTRFALWQKNGGSSISAELRLVEWTSDERRSLELALVEERRALASGKELAAATRQTLENARGRAEAVTARQAILDHEAGIAAAMAEF